MMREFAAQEKCICAIGHGVQILIAAGLVKGRTVTCHPHVRVEVDRAGGIYSPKPVVRADKLITAQGWRCMADFYREIFGCLEAPL